MIIKNQGSLASLREAGSKKEALHCVGISAAAVNFDTKVTSYKCLHTSQALLHLSEPVSWVPEASMGCIIFEAFLSHET